MRALVLTCLILAAAAAPAAARDRDRDRLPDRWEKRHGISTKQKSARKDPDRDGLRNLREYRLKTHPRRRDTDGDGAWDGIEVRRGTDPRRAPAAPIPIPRAPLLPPPAPLLPGPGPAPVKPPTPTRTPTPTPTATATPTPTPPPPPPPPPQLGCEPGSASAATEAEVRAEVVAGHDVCVRTDIGTLDLGGLHPPERVVIATAEAGRIGGVQLVDVSNLELRGRALSVDTRESRDVTLESCTLGGTREERTTENLVLVHEHVEDLKIRNCDLGWTLAGNTGNAGYGIRVVEGDGARGTIHGLTIAGNRIHHIGADGIQGFGAASDVLIDRNEISYVAPEFGSDEHSDDIQVLDHGPNLRITNNYLHHNGWLDDGLAGYGESGPYIHGDDQGDALAMTFENNLVRDERNFLQVGGLATGGRVKSNLLFRRNTFLDNGNRFVFSPDPEWDIDGGEDNVYERNIASNLVVVTPGPHTTFRDLLDADGLEFDAVGNCTSPACNPPGQEPIGYRKPAGAPW